MKPRSRLITADRWLRYLFYGAFALLLVLLCATEPLWLIPVVLTAILGFGIVTLLRRAINAPRPYELSGTPPLLPKNTAGLSFPSRHVASAFLIATLWWPLAFWVSLILYGAGAAIAWLRVAGGVHFARDVIAGALIGAGLGFLGLWVGSLWLL